MEKPNRYYAISSDTGNPVYIAVSTQGDTIYLHMDINGHTSKRKINKEIVSALKNGFNLENSLENRLKWRAGRVLWVSLKIEKIRDVAYCRWIVYGLGFYITWFKMEVSKLHEMRDFLEKVESGYK
jgi:hypothetical protein